ncbi:MAG: hypothetical protein Kow0068_13940 [Marinilabiliales bacterium]
MEEEEIEVVIVKNLGLLKDIKNEDELVSLLAKGLAYKDIVGAATHIFSKKILLDYETLEKGGMEAARLRELVHFIGYDEFGTFAAQFVAGFLSKQKLLSNFRRNLIIFQGECQMHLINILIVMVI